MRCDASFLVYEELPEPPLDSPRLLPGSCKSCSSTSVKHMCRSPARRKAKPADQHQLGYCEAARSRCCGRACHAGAHGHVGGPWTRRSLRSQKTGPCEGLQMQRCLQRQRMMRGWGETPAVRYSLRVERAFRKVPPGSPEDQEAVLAALESLVATTGTETKTGRSHVRNQPPRYVRQISAIRPAEAPKAAQTKAAKKRSSSSSSEDKRSLG